MDAKLLDVGQAAALLGLHSATLYRMARARRIPCVRLGRRIIRFDPRALERYLKQKTVEVREAAGR
ncbi:MAG TPA: helix-turn-helix domain-containing protein [Methylomirabilota bacterium]|jgi:excisionase family DNA binding protein|nr:helix-turn-helix domain-containing protein [Methylomirabilota bacterium]